MLGADIAWLDRTIDELRADALGWGQPIPREFAEARHELKACQTLRHSRSVGIAFVYRTHHHPEQGHP